MTKGNFKTCRKCGVTKPIADYHRNKQMSDGYINACKICVKEMDNIRYLKNKKDPMWMHNKRVRERAYYVTYNKNPSVIRKGVYNHNAKYPEKYKARSKSQRISKLKGFNNHHWSYKEEHSKDVIQIEASMHKSFHRFMTYDQEHYQYRTNVDFNESPKGMLLNTKSIHIEYFEFIKANYKF